MPERFSTPDPDIIVYANGIYYVRIGDRERSLRTNDFATARKRKAEIMALLDRTGFASAGLRFGGIIDDYKAFRKTQLETKVQRKGNKAERGRRTISLATFKEIEDLWELHLGPYWKGVRLIKADTEKWTDYTEQVDVIDLANHRKVFLGILKWCVTKKYIKTIPALPIPKVHRRERRVLKNHEVRKIFEHAEGSILLFISMYLFMQMRRKEIMTLRWSNIFFLEKYLVLDKSEVKIRKGRALPINPFVHQLLRARKNAQEKKKMTTDFVFPNRKNQHRHADLSGLKTAWNTIMRKCGWETGYITPHDLRATGEAHAHKDNSFTDTQREKFAGASIDVQKKTYVNFDASDIRGLESVVKVQGLDKILKSKTKKHLGKTRGEQHHGKLH